MAIIKYDYKDPKDMSAFKVINEGDGWFKILEINSKTSKSGNEMFVMICRLKDKAGNETLYNHYLVHNEYLPDNMYRICEAIGRIDLYKSTGTNTEDLLGTAGQCKIKTEENNFGKQSKIARFIAYKSMQEQEQEEGIEEAAPVSDDEIPF